MNAKTIEFFRVAEKLKGDEFHRHKICLGDLSVSLEADRFVTKASVEHIGERFCTFYVSTQTAFIFSGSEIYKGHGAEEAQATLKPKELQKFYGVQALIAELFGTEAKL